MRTSRLEAFGGGVTPIARAALAWLVPGRRGERLLRSETAELDRSG